MFYQNRQFLIFSILYSATYAYDVTDTSDAMAYLARFGYLGKDTASSMNIVDAGAVLKEFQHMAGIRETGELDPETLKMMNSPRCGNLDLDEEMIPDGPDGNSGNSVRRKRYKLSGTGRKWEKRELTYRITKFSDQMSIKPEMVQRDVAQAFKIWEGATNLNFIPSKDKNVDIEIGFATAKHHDAFPFDGPGKTLAHAFSPGPGLGGDVHFDDHEKWTVDSPAGTNVLFVAVHEIGHSLGLSHSDQKGAIMQAFYGGYRPHLKLHSDDIAGIQHLYGKRETRPSFTTRLFSPKKVELVTKSPLARQPAIFLGPTFSSIPKSPNLCNKDTKVDAMTNIGGFHYIFSGPNVFKLEGSQGTISPGLPQLISNVFKGLESDIEAAFTRRNGKTYFLKGGKYWRFSGFEMDSGYPKSIAKHFPGIPDHVDSAFESPTNQQIYFTKGKEYWRFDPLARGHPHVHSIYPLPLLLWGVTGSGLDAASPSPQNNGKVLLFKGNQIWELDSRTFSTTDKSNELTRDKWLQCSGNQFYNQG